jgi:hypothetical protein
MDAVICRECTVVVLAGYGEGEENRKEKKKVAETDKRN